MSNTQLFDVIIIGGSYSGLSAAMSLGRSLKNVLIIDSGNPCNKQTPHAHNFITQDGAPPAEIAQKAKEQVLKYPTVQWLNDLATKASKEGGNFAITTASGTTFRSRKLHLAMGVRDVLPSIPGVAECWGISVVHCPFCHGYEAKKQKTGLLSNGEKAFHMAQLLRNWTDDLMLFTNGPSTLSAEQESFLATANVNIISSEIESLSHTKGQLQQLNFKDNISFQLPVLYTTFPVELPSDIPQQLGCELTEEGLINVDDMHKTSVPNVFASGDCTTFMRSVAFAVATGNKSGAVMVQSFVFGDY